MAPASFPSPTRQRLSSLTLIRIIVDRELRDTLRDWRIVLPIVALTLLFPWLMNWTAQQAVTFVQERQAPIIGERLLPFLLMIVGFFPISFSLIIALETFVGEKERRSIEPLLSMPISDLELYLGKMIAATVLPLTASLAGILIYLGGLYWSVGYNPPPDLLVLILLLNVTSALLMVAGAVVISSQTTSVRAANLLASFIIVPMAVLIQVESIIMFWGHYRILWLIALGLLVITVMLVRMGIRTFNREEILGREIDELNVRRVGWLLAQFFVQPPGWMPNGQVADGPALRRLVRWLARVYRHDLPFLLKHNWLAMAAVTLALVGALLLGWALVDRYPLPPGTIRLEELTEQRFDSMSSIGFLPAFTTGSIFRHNVQVLLLGGVLAIISLGVLSVLMLMVPLGIIGFIAGQIAWMGYSPLTFIAAFVLPHGLLEVPAAVLATAFALRLGAALTAPRTGLTVGEGLIAALADLGKVFLFLVVPLLLVAAFIEVNLTPQIVLAVYGR